MKIVSVKLNDEEHEILSSYSITIEDKIREVLRNHVSIRRLSKKSRLEDFMFDNVEVTNNPYNRVTLADAYTIYTDWCQTKGDINILTKQKFRSGMQHKNVVYDTGGGGRKIFRGIKMEEESSSDINDYWEDTADKFNEDEEWEL